MPTPTAAELEAAIAEELATRVVGSKTLVQRFRDERQWDVDNRLVKQAITAVRHKKVEEAPIEAEVEAEAPAERAAAEKVAAAPSAAEDQVTPAKHMCWGCGAVA
eukprot:4366738-Prymnesium_polylepis.1